MEIRLPRRLFEGETYELTQKQLDGIRAKSEKMLRSHGKHVWQRDTAFAAGKHATIRSVPDFFNYGLKTMLMDYCAASTTPEEFMQRFEAKLTELGA